MIISRRAYRKEVPGLNICEGCDRREQDWSWTDRGKYVHGWTCADGENPDDCERRIRIEEE